MPSCVFVLVDETHFFHPNFLENLTKKLNSKYIIKGAIINNNVPRNINFNYYFLKNLKYLKISEIIKLSFILLKYKLELILNFLKIIKKLNSVETVLQNKNSPIIDEKTIFFCLQYSKYFEY